jgi:hypothetical protein
VSFAAIDLGKDLLGDAHRVEGCENAAADGALQEDLHQFLPGQTVVQRPADMQFDFQRAVQGREHSEGYFLPAN